MGCEGMSHQKIITGTITVNGKVVEFSSGYIVYEHDDIILHGTVFSDTNSPCIMTFCHNNTHWIRLKRWLRNTYKSTRSFITNCLMVIK